MKVANSNRLSYALMGPADAELLYQLDQDEAVMQYINGGKKTSRQDILDVFLPRMAQYTDATQGWGLWKVTVTASNQFIGWILVRPMDYFSAQPQYDNLELGWRFMRNSWGQGYATEAAKQIKNSLAEQVGIKRFAAIAMPGNAASIAIMKKLGMRYIKTDIYRDPLGDDEVVFYQLDL